MRRGEGQDIDVHLAQAIRRLAPMLEFCWETLNGYPPAVPDRSILPLLSCYGTKDERKVLPANVYPALKSKMLALLDCADNPAALEHATQQWNADDLEQAAEEQGIVMLRRSRK
jgi:hypothetical protein